MGVTPPSPFICQQQAIDAQVRRLLRLPSAEADAICEQEVARAIRDWRITDATEWHRIRLRVRLARNRQARDFG